MYVYSTKAYFLNDRFTKWTPFCFRRIDCSIAMQTVFSSHSLTHSPPLPANPKLSSFLLIFIYYVCTYIHNIYIRSCFAFLPETKYI